MPPFNPRPAARPAAPAPAPAPAAKPAAPKPPLPTAKVTNVPAKAPAKPGVAVARPIAAAKPAPPPVAALPVGINEYMLQEDSSSARADFDTKDLALPFVRILQANSPEVKKSEERYMDGAVEGMFFNTATRKLYDGEAGIIVIPVAHRKSFTEWTPRIRGGGMVKDHGVDGSILERTKKNPETGKSVTAAGTEVVQASMYFVFIVDPETGEYEMATMSLASTQLKHARKWNSFISTELVDSPTGKGQFLPAMFYRAYRITTVPESNAKGSWMGHHIEQFTQEIDGQNVPVFTFDLPGGAQIYLAAREYRQAVEGGTVKASASQVAEVLEVEEEPAGGGADYEVTQVGSEREPGEEAAEEGDEPPF